MARDDDRLYVGVDVGGTNTVAALATECGEILTRQKYPTPHEGSPEEALHVVIRSVEEVLLETGITPSGVRGIGLAVPGVVDADEGVVIVTPNMNMGGLRAVELMGDHFDVPVALGNDVNMGTLGEKWLGAAQNAESAVGIFIGTGIGGGIIMGGRVVRGSRLAAGEIGHMVLDPDGPLCGCGNRGCFEAMAGRTALERDVREALAEGRHTVVAEFMDDPDDRMRSKFFKRALKLNDPLITEIVNRASRVIGAACLSVRHLLDPEVIVLGGGMIEACGKFMMPVVRQMMAEDKLPGSRPGSYVTESELGDDAVVLGSVALIRQTLGEDPLDPAQAVLPEYPRIDLTSDGHISVGAKVYDGDVYVRGDGKVKKRKTDEIKSHYGTEHKVGSEEVLKVCRGHPELLVIGAGTTGGMELTPNAERVLAERRIELVMVPTPEAAEAFNRADVRKAALMHGGC